MAGTLLVFFIALLWALGSGGAGAQVFEQILLGEKNLEAYHGRHWPRLEHDPYLGHLEYADDQFYQSFLNRFIFPEQDAYAAFFRSELTTGATCPNALLDTHRQEIRYLYRLVTLSYFLEAQWHLDALSKQLRFKSGCRFDLQTWAQLCRPKTQEMREFVDNLKQFKTPYPESFEPRYQAADWLREFQRKDFKWYSHYRLDRPCSDGCTETTLESNLKRSCEEDQELMKSICSEEDAIYGLSGSRDAYFLLGRSVAINPINHTGEGLACLRRFSEVMSHKEVRHPQLANLFPPLLSFLREKYEERYLQGRAFFLGAGKEFKAKGLGDHLVKDQPFIFETVKMNKDEVPQPTARPAPSEPVTKAKIPTPAPVVVQVTKKDAPEVKPDSKSAFLQAAEVRALQDLDRVDVDMLRLKYDYVFSLNMINNLSERLKSFMTRDALKEMATFDKLGSRDGPVPLLFIKFMIDMDEHQGLWNLVSVLGDRFYVSNEIDASLKTYPELIQLANDDSTGRQWQIFVLRP